MIRFVFGDFTAKISVQRRVITQDIGKLN